jgi:hypothetical protein
MIWMIFAALFVSLAVGALLYYIRSSAKAGHRVLVAHGMILLLGLVLAGLGVAALKLSGFGV